MENIEEADRMIKTADHMIYTTYPVIKDKRLLLKILSEIAIAVSKSIACILQYDYVYEKIELYKDPKRNFETFKNKCAPDYGITQEEIKKIMDLLDLAERHKRSTMEFVKDDKIVIITDGMESHIVTLEKIKEFIFLSKNLSKKIKNKVLRTTL